MEVLPGEKLEDYFKATGDEIQILMKRDTWEIVLRKSVDDQIFSQELGLLSARGNLIGKSGN